MNPDHQSKEQELKSREAELKEREIKIRMRELEAELEDSTPVQPTVKHTEPLARPWYKRLPRIAKFGLIVVGVMVAVKIASWLATLLLLVGVGWAGYTLFLEGDRNKK